MPPVPLPLDQRTFGAVLFDMDGTLIDSIPAVERSWLTWAAENSVAPERLLGFHGVPALGVIGALLPDLDAAGRQASVQRIEDLEVADVDGVALLPGAQDALTTLIDAGAKVAIVTSCTDPLYEARVTATGLRRPPVVVTASMVKRGKPAPDPFLLAAERLGVDTGDCLVVEDATSGLRAAHAAGVTSTLAVLHTTPHAQLAELADLVVGGMDGVTFGVDEESRITLATR